MQKLEANNRLFKLGSYVDTQGALRVGGRISKSLIQQEIQHPVLLPQDCRITNLIVKFDNLIWCHKSECLVFGSLD